MSGKGTSTLTTFTYQEILAALQSTHPSPINPETLEAALSEPGLFSKDPTGTLETMFKHLSAAQVLRLLRFSPQKSPEQDLQPLRPEAFDFPKGLAPPLSPAPNSSPAETSSTSHSPQSLI